ncbi:hypothetical protein BRIN106911_12485 [Brevibacillus invocatus]
MEFTEEVRIVMEELLFLLSLDDLFALLAMLVGGVATACYLRRYVNPQKLAIHWHARDAYQPSIHPNTVEAYPMKAGQMLRYRLFRRMHTDGESDTYVHLLA